MHFDTTPNRRDTGLLDAELLYFDRMTTANQLTATETSNVVQFDLRKGGYFKVIVKHPAITSITPGTNDWVAVLEAQANPETIADPAEATWREIGRVTLQATAGQQIITSSAAAAQAILPPLTKPSRDNTRVRLEPVGSPGPLQCAVYVTP